LLAIDDVELLDTNQSLALLRLKNHGAQKMGCEFALRLSDFSLISNIFPQLFPLVIKSPDISPLVERDAELSPSLEQLFDGNGF
jgi:hypothetical protein